MVRVVPMVVAREATSSSRKLCIIYLGYCPHPVTVYIRGPIKSYIQPYYSYYPAVTEGGAVPNIYPVNSQSCGGLPRQNAARRWLVRTGSAKMGSPHSFGLEVSDFESAAVQIVQGLA